MSTAVEIILYCTYRTFDIVYEIETIQTQQLKTDSYNLRDFSFLKYTKCLKSTIFFLYNT